MGIIGEGASVGCPYLKIYTEGCPMIWLPSGLNNSAPHPHYFILGMVAPVEFTVEILNMPSGGR